jgi:TorA maturation chaperone TorD
VGPSGERRNQASWFAFIAKAFLSADPADLRRFVNEMRYRGAPEHSAERLLEGMGEALDEAPESVEREFVRLFANPAGPVCPPWQSSHTGDRSLMGPPHRSALAWYRSAGFEPKAIDEPADHAGLLLGFYARLIEMGAPPALREAFQNEHLLWIPGWCDSIILEARHPFYKLLAEAARESLR